MVRPTTGVLVYDGDCAFCQRGVDVGTRWLPDEFRAEPYQFLDLPALGLTPEQAGEAVWWVQPSASPRRGHRAFAAVLMAQSPWWWRTLGVIVGRPPISWIAAPVYAWVARNRHRLPGGSAECRVRRP